MKLRNKHSNEAGDPCEADRQPEIPKGKNSPHQCGRTVLKLPPIVCHGLGQKHTKVCARVPRIGSDLAWAWPLISPPEDYQQEAEDFTAQLRAHARRPLRTLLHLGCGGGHLDHWFQAHFAVTGVDLSPEMLRIARTKAEAAGVAERVTLVEGDYAGAPPGGIYRLAFVVMNTFLHLPDLEAPEAEVTAEQVGHQCAGRTHPIELCGRLAHNHGIAPVTTAASSAATSSGWMPPPGSISTAAPPS